MSGGAFSSNKFQKWEFILILLKSVILFQIRNSVAIVDFEGMKYLLGGSV